MNNVIIKDRARQNAIAYQVEPQFNKQIEFLKTNTRHNSLKFQPLTGGQGLWRFRITKKYWGITLKPKSSTIEVTDVIIHLP